MTFKSPQDIYNLLTSLNIQDKEQLICFSIRGRQTLLSKHIIHVGEKNHLHLDLKKLFTSPILSGADAMISAHNHPNGVVYPSQADILTTRRIKQVSTLLNIPLIDHIIFTQDSFFSFSENNLL